MEAADFSGICENRKMRSPIGMVSITEKMASMQSMYGQNAGHINSSMTNDSESNFQETALQIEDSNVNICKNPINQNHQNAGPMNNNMTNDSDSNFQDNALQIKDSDVNICKNQINQDQVSQKVKIADDVIGNQESHVNLDINQHDTDAGPDANMIHEQSPSLFSSAHIDHDDMMDHDAIQIKPEAIESQPDIDYITMTTSDDEESSLIVEEHSWKPQLNRDRKKLLYDEESKAYKLSSIQLKAARAMLDKEVAELEHKSVTQMLQDPQTTSTAYTDIFVEKDYESPLYLSSFVVDSPGCNDKFKCNACNTEYKIRQSF